MAGIQSTTLAAMRLALLGLIGIAMLGLTIWPMLDAPKKRIAGWQWWIVGGLLFGPFAGLAYLVKNLARRGSAEPSTNA